MDVNAIDLAGAPDHLRAELEAAAASNVKRVARDGAAADEYFDDAAQSPYAIASFMEMKTVWHPMGP
jgi:hypothetical protein